jgi:integrase
MATIKLPGVMKHPKTGMLWLRRVVPPHLRQWVDQREFRHSLGTKDIAVAKARYPAAAAAIQRRLDEAEEAYIDSQIPDDPDYEPISRKEAWAVFLDNMSADELLEVFLGKLTPEQMDLWKRWQARLEQPIVRRLGPVVPPAAPPVARPHAHAEGGRSNGTSLYALLDAWATSRRKPERTVYAWRLILSKLVQFVGHDDAERLTKQELVHWRDATLADGRSPKTVADYLTVVRTIVQAALDDDRLARQDNPVRGVKVLAEPEQTDGVRPYTRDEASKVLAVARQQAAPELRYLPVLLFSTPARISELAGLRVKDVWEDDAGRMTIEITPTEARGVKNRKARSTPLPDWAAEEIREYVVKRQREAQPDDLLFPGVNPAKGNMGGNLVKRWSAVVRKKAGIKDENISPAHSARHLYIDLCRAAGLDEALIDRLTGHTTPGLQARYGKGWDLEALHRAISRITWPGGPSP